MGTHSLSIENQMNNNKDKDKKQLPEVYTTGFEDVDSLVLEIVSTEYDETKNPPDKGGNRTGTWR